MKVIKASSVGVLSVLIVFLSFVFVMTIHLNSLTSLEFYQDMFTRSDFYAQLETKITRGEGSTMLRFSPGYLQIMVDGAVGNLLAYLRGDRGELDLRISIDVNATKEYLKKELIALPVCAPGVIPLVDGEYVCRYTHVNASTFANQVIRETLEGYPLETLDLSTVLKLGEESSGAKTFRDLRELVMLLKPFLWMQGILLVLLLFLLYLFHGNASKHFLLNLGLIMFFSGVLLLGSSLYLELVLKTLSLTFDPLISSVFITGVSMLFYRQLMIGGVLLLVGLAIFMIGLIKHKPVTVHEIKQHEIKHEKPSEKQETNSKTLV